MAFFYLVLQNSSYTKIICMSTLKSQGYHYQYIRLLMKDLKAYLNIGQLLWLMRYIMCLLIRSVIEGQLNKMLQELPSSTYQKRLRMMDLFSFTRYDLYDETETCLVAFDFQHACFFMYLFLFQATLWGKFKPSKLNGRNRCFETTILCSCWLYFCLFS